MSNQRGVDLSHHNDNVNFAQLKADGIQFVALKATEGVGNVDPTFATRRQQALAAGFHKILLYHFLHPTNDAAAEADHFADVVKALHINERIVVDVEAIAKSPGDWDHLSVATKLAKVKNYVFEVKTRLHLSASDVIVYGSLGWLRGEFGSHLSELTFMPLWAARYGVSELGDTSPWPKAMIWQNSEHGTVRGAGAPGQVDTDIWLDQALW